MKMEGSGRTILAKKVSGTGPFIPDRSPSGADFKARAAKVMECLVGCQQSGIQGALGEHVEETIDNFVRAAVVGDES